VRTDRYVNITATANSDVNLTCTTPTASTVRWILDREDLRSPVEMFNGYSVNPWLSRISVSSHDETGHSELTIYNVRRRDAGNYTCRVINSSSKHIADYMHFTLSVIG